MKQLRRLLRAVLIVIALLLVLGGTMIYATSQNSILPATINMSSAGTNSMAGMNMTPATPGPDAIPITQLVAPQTNAPIKSFTLTAETATIDLGDGKPTPAFTYNGTIPGPELRVQQGDLVVVTLINKLPESTTIHWHGVSVPNAEDGVAGLTQNAVKPGESYTYRFVANDVGTYWYHSHQDTSTQLPLGLFGALIVEPKDAPVHYDRDYLVFLHEWNVAENCRQTCAETLSVNDSMTRIALAAKPGEKVRLRIANSGNEIHSPVLIGAPFEVIALDGHDLNEPTPLTSVALPISSAQRYDLSFVMPASGTVALIDSAERAAPANQHPMVVIGDEAAEVAYPQNPALFDFTSYGVPAADTITIASHFDVQQDLVLDNQLGFFNGAFTMTFPINGKTYPNIPSIMVRPGDLVKLHFVGNGTIPHSMHLHGHYFTVLTHNGKPLTGSPVHLDTITVNPGESFDVAFLADNPGLWMLHCHMVDHDAHGMDMMVEYPNIETPFSIGQASGNNPF